MSLWCCAATSQMHFHHRRYQAISATQIVDTLGVVGGRSLPRRAKRWRPSCETRRSASTYDSKKKPEVGKPANLAASRNNSNSWPPTEVAPGMPVGVRLSGHTRFYNSDSLPKGLSWMPGYRIEPLRQRCSNDVADSSVTSVQGHCLRSRGLPHNAKRVSVRPKQPLCSCSGGVVYQLVCEQFRSRRRSRKNDDDGERKDVAYISMPVIQDEYTNSEKVSSEVDNKEGVVDDRGKTGYHKQDQKEDSPRDDADNNEASFVDSRNKENAMRGTYTIKATPATMSLTVQEVRTIAETKSEGHENASDGSSVNSDSSRSTDSPSTHGASQSPRRAESDDGSIEEDINNEDSDSDA